MNILKYLAFLILGLSVAGFVWLAWFLITTPSSSFDTQGPGLLGAFVMFGSQVLGIVGIALTVIWKLISMWLNYRGDGEHLKP